MNTPKYQTQTFSKEKIGSVGYYAVIDSNKAKGVVNKIEGVVASCRGHGLSAESCIYEESIAGVFAFFKDLILTKHKTVFIRYTTMLAPIVCFITMFLRLNGKNVIVDVPTPRRVVLKEVLGVDKSILYKVSNLIVLSLSASWVFWPANLVIQYADESRWFNFGLINKTLKMGNGVVIKNNQPLQQAPWPSNELVLIGVARLAYWHGFDRVLRVINELNQESLSFTIRFKIVGEGNELNVLKKLVDKLQLEAQVEFTGILHGQALDQAFEDAHIGIASLGLYRKNLTEASDLKTREYMSRGFSVIAAGKDIDFPNDNPFRIEIPNDDSLDELKNLLRSYSVKRLPNGEQAREYALQHLSLEAKAGTMLNAII